MKKGLREQEEFGVSPGFEENEGIIEEENQGIFRDRGMIEEDGVREDGLIGDEEEDALF